MLTETGILLKRIRKWCSRSQWAIRLLRLPRLDHPSPHPGLLLVQIDGLSQMQFNRALNKGRVPFMRGLLARERYAQHTMYSGLPSNTPAVQSEIFYGVKGSVPAFNFVDRKTGKVVNMMDAGYVPGVESALKARAGGVLEGGSAYSDIFTGGAGESHVCWGNLGLSGFLHAINPLVLPFLVVLYLDIFLRTFVLLIVEFLIALVECARNSLNPARGFFYELHFVWMRVLVGVFLRELIVAGASIDVMRGLPVVHVNFLGYDEQAHCRGPSTPYAHWALQGIDDAICRIAYASRRSTLRHYDVWIYSDHGQETTTPYAVKYGMTVNEAVEKVFREGYRPVRLSRAGLRQTREAYASLRSRRVKITAPPYSGSIDYKGRASVVTAMGPLGEIYVSSPLTSADVAFYGEKLVKEAHIPLVMARGENNTVIAWTAHGSFVLPRQVAEVFGDTHPFLEEFKEDVIRICHHENAGEFIIAGWAKGEQPLSLSMEFGAHAGMGTEETKAFALLPMDAPLAPNGKEYLRPSDLRAAVQAFRDQIIPGMAASSPVGQVPRSLRIMSYNVQGCMGRDGQISTDKVARIIARHKPDIVCMQELDHGRARSQGTHQAELIARKLEMHYQFHSAFRWKDEQYGNAILSRYPMTLIKMDTLPERKNVRYNEPRGAMWVSVRIDGVNVQVFNTHLSLWPGERIIQINEILGPQWLGHPDCRGPVVLCGDFNALPGSYTHRKVCEHLQDCRVGGRQYRKGTWFGDFPLWQLDHIFVSEDFCIEQVNVSRTSLEKSASDHLPLIAQVRLTESVGLERGPGLNGALLNGGV